MILMLTWALRSHPLLNTAFKGDLVATKFTLLSYNACMSKGATVLTGEVCCLSSDEPSPLPRSLSSTAQFSQKGYLADCNVTIYH